LALTWDVANKDSARGSKSRPKRRRQRRLWRAMDALGKISRLKRLRACRRNLVGPTLVIARRGPDAHFSGLETCGSVWACPMCAAKIQTKRTDELLLAVEHAHAHGLRIALGTLTMRHKAGKPLKPMWDALTDAFAAAIRTDRRVRRSLEAMGSHGWVRRVECTHGEHGWHLHAHVLIFYEGGSLEPLTDAMWRGWHRRIRAHGFTAQRDYGIDVRELDLEAARAEAARYLTKATFPEEKSAAVHAAAARHASKAQEKSAALELAGQLGKAAAAGNRAPFEILAALVDHGRAEDLAIWHEWEQASRGRRAMGFSKGFRERFCLESERTDEELAAENDHDQFDVALLDRVQWEHIMAKRLQAGLLEAAETSDLRYSFAAVAAFMEAHGLPPPMSPNDERGDPRHGWDAV
jgi:Replication protein